jgi:uncharacterized protein YceK
MKYLLMALVLVLLSGCSTFFYNEAGVRRACKGGVDNYDDGNMTFSCRDPLVRDHGPERTQK